MNFNGQHSRYFAACHKPDLSPISHLETCLFIFCYCVNSFFKRIRKYIEESSTTNDILTKVFRANTWNNAAKGPFPLLRGSYILLNLKLT